MAKLRNRSRDFVTKCASGRQALCLSQLYSGKALKTRLFPLPCEGKVTVTRACFGSNGASLKRKLNVRYAELSLGL